MDLFEHVGRRIRDLRGSFGGKGISQEELAEAINVTGNTISRWETATYHPSIQDLDKLARFFGVSILEFFPTEQTPESRVRALLRAARELPDDDLKELERYAEFRLARNLTRRGKTPRAGRGAAQEE
jgi:transcriptional regulator with XRE-family HTH domain